ncbi:tetratricopeptide repeat protein [candidate division KSB1 bacterium]
MKISTILITYSALCIFLFCDTANAQEEYNRTEKEVLDYSILKSLYGEIQCLLSNSSISSQSREKAVRYADFIMKHDREMGYQAFHEIYEKTGEFDNLEKSYKKRIEDFPNKVIYRIELALFYSNSIENHDKSFAILEKVILEHPEAKIGLYIYGKTCAVTGSNLNKGVKFLNDYLQYENQLYPDLAHYYIGEIFRTKNEISKAIKKYKDALEVNPECALAARALDRINKIKSVK